jgi:hypothetical protein
VPRQLNLRPEDREAAPAILMRAGEMLGRAMGGEVGGGGEDDEGLAGGVAEGAEDVGCAAVEVQLRDVEEVLGAEAAALVS